MSSSPLSSEPTRPTAARTAEPSFAALRHPDYRVFLTVATISMMADNIEHVISYWILFEKFHAPWLGGLAVITHWLPFLLFSVWAGVIADRHDPRRLLQVGIVLFMLVSIGWGLLFLTDTLTVPAACALLVVHGLAGVAWGPAGQLLVHDIIGKGQLVSAIRMMSTSRQLGALMGPAVGGGLLIGFGPVWGILINALLYLPLIIWLELTKYGTRPASGGSAGSIRGLGLADVVATIRLIAGNRMIVSMTLLVGCVSLLIGNSIQAQMPEFAYDLHAGSGHGAADISYSILLAASAVGALTAGIVLESRNLLHTTPRTAMALVIGWCVTMICFALTRSYLLAVSMMVAAGFLNLAFNSMTQTLVQTAAPAEIRGRVIGLYNMASNGLRTFSGVTIGFGGSLIGIHWALAMSALVLGGITIALWQRHEHASS